MKKIVRITLSNPARLRRLLAFFAFDATAIVTPIGEHEIEVAFLGSLNEWAQRRALELHLRARMAAHPGAIVILND